MTLQNGLRRGFFAGTGTLVALVVLGGCINLTLPGGGGGGGGGSTQPTITPPPADSTAQGISGVEASAGLPGMIITIQNVVDATTNGVPTIGQPVAVKFTLTTRSGQTIPPSDLDRFSTYISGPTDNYQRVIPAEGDKTKIAVNPDGSYLYTFSVPFPATYAAPYNEPAGATPAAGELTGMPITDGTYTVGMEARRAQTRASDGAVIEDAGDATLDFVLGSATLAPRQVVAQANCQTCHSQLSVHGNNRFSVTGCVLCHTAGALDLNSNGQSIEFKHMIHEIHKGSENPLVEATVNGPDPFSYKLVGFQKSVNDFSFIEFPYMPGGTGFNEQTRNCKTCHEGATQGDNAYNRPSRSACTGCHTDLDFNTGTVLDGTNNTIMLGQLPQSQLGDGSVRMLVAGAITHTFKDTECTLCHSPGTSLDSKVEHLPSLSNPSNINNLKIVIDSVGGNSGAGFFQPGDHPTVTFHIVDGASNTIAIDDATNVLTISYVLSGPAENYQIVEPATGTSASVKSTSFDANGNVTGQTINCTPTTGKGPFTYTAAALPATFRAPANDSTNFTYAGGWGELSGQALVPADYTIALWAAHEYPIPSTSRFREASPVATSEIRIGSAGPTPGYSGFVTDAKCNACHGDLSFHGNGRKGVALCVLCHTGGAEDRPNTVSGQTQAPEADTIDFKVLIHKIHNARHLSVVEGGGKYDIVGFSAGAPSNTGAVSDFSHGDFPYMPGGAKECTGCHATPAWREPVERPDVAIWKVACTSCHDGASTAVHVQLNTINGIQEGCAVCHGPGRIEAVDMVHQLP